MHQNERSRSPEYAKGESMRKTKAKLADREH